MCDEYRGCKHKQNELGKSMFFGLGLSFPGLRGDWEVFHLCGVHLNSEKRNGGMLGGGEVPFLTKKGSMYVSNVCVYMMYACVRKGERAMASFL